MFVVLEVTERKAGGVLSGLYSLLVKPRIYLETRECPGARFALIKAESVNGALNWGDIEKVCGAYSDRVLLPEGIIPPEGSKIKSPSLPSFNKRVLTRTACEIIKLSRIPMYRRVLGLIDLEAAYPDILYDLLSHYTSVRVVTKNTEKYTMEAARVMDELGAPVTVSESFNSLEECVIALSPSAVYTPEEIKLSCPVIAGDAFVSAGKLNLVTSLRITPGDGFLKACPKDIDPHYFAGAAYEFCGTGMGMPSSGLREFGGFIAEKMVFAYREAGISDVVRAVIECTGLKPESLIS